MSKSYTAVDVKRISLELGIGMHEAKLKLDKIDMLSQVANAKTIEDIRPVLYKLIDSL